MGVAGYHLLLVVVGVFGGALVLYVRVMLDSRSEVPVRHEDIWGLVKPHIKERLANTAATVVVMTIFFVIVAVW